EKKVTSSPPRVSFVVSSNVPAHNSLGSGEERIERLVQQLNHLFPAPAPPLPQLSPKQKNTTSCQTLDSMNSKLECAAQTDNVVAIVTPSIGDTSRCVENEKFELEKMQKAMCAEREEWQTSKQKLEMENTQLRQSLQQEQHKMDVLHRDLSADKEKIAEIQKNTIQLETQVHHLKAQLSNKDMQFLRLQNEFKQVDSTLIYVHNTFLGHCDVVIKKFLKIGTPVPGGTDGRKKEMGRKACKRRGVRSQTTQLINELMALKNELSERCQTLTKDMESKTQAIAQLKSSLSAIEQRFDEDKLLWKESSQNWRDKCDQLTTENTNKDLQIKELTKYLDTLQREKKEYDLKTEHDTNKQCQLKTALEKATNDISDLKQMLQEAFQSERKYKKFICELNEVVKKQNERFLNDQTENQQLTQRIEEMKQLYSNTLLAKQSLQTLLSDTQGRHEEKERKVHELELKLASFQLLETNFNAQLQEKNTEIKRLTDLINENTQHLRNVKDTLNVKEVMLNDQNETIIRLTASQKEHKNEIARWTLKEKEWDNKLQHTLDQVEDWKEKYNSCKEEMDSYLAAVNELELLKQETAKYRSKCEELQAEIHEKEKTIAYVSNEVEQMGKLWQSEKNKIHSQHKETIAAKQIIVDELEHKIAELEELKLSNAEKIKLYEEQTQNEKKLRESWQQKCAQAVAKVATTEKEMRIILLEMEKQKAAVSTFAKTLNLFPT
ncbi:UBX domain containing protein, partial [Reticulomyxa filosa]